MASVDLQEKANFTRLNSLLLDKGTEALRATFDSIHPPATLSADLNTHRIYLLKLKPRVINLTQWDLLYPPSVNPPDSKSFDATLLTVLLRNICGLPPPATGWNVMPPDTDRSVSANIARIKLFRNEFCADVTSTQVDNATFESSWQKIAQALVDLEIPQNDIDDLKTSPLEPKEETYLKTSDDGDVIASVDLQEKANFARLSRLLLDKGTESLRTTFDSIHPPANLSTVLNTHRVSLLKLKPRIINVTQWDLLYPPSGKPPDSKSFNSTLLTVLLRNICDLPLPATGWNVMPPDTDRSLSANIVRIRLFRSRLYANVTSTQVDNVTFESLWQEIAQALVDLKIPQNDLDALKFSPLEPKEEKYLKTSDDGDGRCRSTLEAYVKTVNEHNVKALEEWKSNDKIIEEMERSSITECL